MAELAGWAEMGGGGVKELAGVADLAEQSEMAGLAVLKERAEEAD